MRLVKFAALLTPKEKKEHPDGLPCYVNANLVSAITGGYLEDEKNPGDVIHGTIIYLTDGTEVSVEEDAETVANRLMKAS